MTRFIHHLYTRRVFKNIQGFTMVLGQLFSQVTYPKKLLLSGLCFFTFLSGYATTYYSATAGGDPTNLNNWWTVNNNTGAHPANFSTAGDVFTVQCGVNTMTTTAGWTVTGTIAITTGTLNISNASTIGTVTIASGSTLTLNASLSIGTSITVSGTLICNGENQITGAGNFTLTSSNTAALQIGSINGITSSGTNGNIACSGATRSFGQNATYTYIGTANQVTGNGLPSTIGALTINNTGSAANNIVSLTTSPTTIIANPATGVLTLTAGVFKIGSANTLNFNNNSSTNGITNNGGSLATTGTNGSDGGTIVALTGSGANFNFTGTGTTAVYNFSIGTAVGSGNRHVVQSTASAVIINGTLTMQDNQAEWTTNAPIYGSASTLSINNNGQQYTPGSATREEWLQIAPGSGTIGTTPGYPNNVIIANVGTSASNYNGNQYGVKLSGGWSINGTFQVGTASASGAVDLDDGGSGTNSFSCGGVIIQNSSKLAAPNSSFLVNGNWSRTGATIGAFINNSSTVTFGGSGADTISLSTGTESSFYNLTINGSSSLNVLLNSPVTLGTSNTLTLTSGVVQTSSTNILSITNTATSAISGTGSNTNMINGPVKWSLINGGTNSYVFPVGSGTTYLPFTLISKNSSAGNVATVQAIASNPGGSYDASLIGISSAEYWSLTTSSSLGAGSTVSISQPTAISPYNAIAQSTTTVNGTYKSIAGTASTDGVSNSTAIPAGSPWFFTFGMLPGTPTITLGSNPSACYSTSSQTAALTYSATTGSPTTYSLSGWSGGSFSNVTNATLTASPILITVPAGTSIGTYTATLTVTNSTTSSNYPISITVNTTPDISAVPSGATSYYKFSGNANDTTGNNNGTLQNSPTSVNDRYGNTGSAYSFNGTTQYVSTATSYNDPTTFSISVWFNTTVANNGVLMGFGNVQTGSATMFDRYIWMNGGELVFYAGSNTLQSTATYNDGNWHLAAATLSPTDGMKLYVDGSLVASNSSYTTAQNYTGYWMIGYSNASYYFNGLLDDVTIYNGTELTSSQVTTLYSGTASNSPVCPGLALSLTETTISGATYLWSGAGTFSPGTTSQNPSVTSGSTGTYTVTVTGSNGCSSVGSTAATVYTSYTWTGTTNANWNVANNWICGVPPYNSSVIIPNVSPNPEPILDSNVTISSVALNSAATLGLNGYVFTINGAVSGTGTISATSASGLVMGASSTGTLYFTGGSNTIDSLRLVDGANITLGSSLNIASVGLLRVGTITGNGATFAAGNGQLTFISDNNGSAQLAPVPNGYGNGGASTISGTANIQCYIHSTNSGISAARRAWRLLTAPISNVGLGTPTTIYTSWQNSGVYVAGVGTMITCPPALVTGANGMDAGINGNYSDYTWTTSSQTLSYISNTKTTNISGTSGNADNVGYFIFVRGDRTPNTINLPWDATINNTTLSATGVLQLGTQTFSSGSALAANGLMLVGNPYASPINFKYVAADTTAGGYTSGLTNLINRFYVWNSNLTGTQGVGGYVCMDDAGNSHSYTKSLGGSGTALYSDLSIQSGQAFFVQATASGTASIGINEVDKNTTSNFIYRPENQQAVGTPDEFGATLSLLNSDSTTSLTDGVVAQFKNGYCDCVDYMDAPKFSNIDEMFSLARYGKQLAIERRPEVVSTDTLFLNLKQMAQRAYQFGFTLNMPNHPDLGARLEDDYTGIKKALNMNGSDTANFIIDANAASQDTGRFKIVFGAVNIVPVYTILNAIQQGNTVLVQWAVSNDQEMTGYILQKSTDGISYVDVYTTNALHITGAYRWLDTTPVAGANYYRVISTDVLNEQSYSPVASVTIASLDPTGIMVFPDPILDGQIRLAFNNMPAGNYHYRLLNETGQELQFGSVYHPGGNATTMIPFAKSTSKGNYALEMFLPNSTTTIVIQVVVE